MGKIICVANQKGGVGKTTSCINLGASLAACGKKILIVDIDPQANATTGLGKKGIKSMYEVLLEGVKLNAIILETELPYLFIAPSKTDLAGGAVELGYVPNREKVLSKTLSQVKNDFSYVFIDCPPSLGLLTLNGLVSADSVLIPIQCEFYAMEGVGKLIDTIQRVKSTLNPGLEIEGILLTMWSRTKLAREVEEEIRNYFKEKVYKTVIPRNIRLAEAPGFGKPIMLYDILSKGAQAYLTLAQEILKREPQRKKAPDRH
ncbi:ParA family protein [candidate division WOR-3 bacterium]|nr:ParA family protein [candidate division WOR-3 bacterium]